MQLQLIKIAKLLEMLLTKLSRRVLLDNKSIVEFCVPDKGPSYLFGKGAL